MTATLPVAVTRPSNRHAPYLYDAMVGSGYRHLNGQPIPAHWLVSVGDVPTFHGTDPDAAAYYVSFARSRGNTVTLTEYTDDAQA